MFSCCSISGPEENALAIGLLVSRVPDALMQRKHGFHHCCRHNEQRNPPGPKVAVTAVMAKQEAKERGSIDRMQSRQKSADPKVSQAPPLCFMYGGIAVAALFQIFEDERCPFQEALDHSHGCLLAHEADAVIAALAELGVGNVTGPAAIAQTTIERMHVRKVI